MAKDGEAMTTKKKIWPRGKPLPHFKSLAAEERFWATHEFDLTDADFSTDHGRAPAIVPRMSRAARDRQVPAARRKAAG